MPNIPLENLYVYMYVYSNLINVYIYYTCRWNLKMPSMVEGSVLIMSRAGTGTAMFSMGELIN